MIDPKIIEQQARMLRLSDSHLAASMVHLDRALDYYREFDRAAGVPIAKVIRIFSRRITTLEKH